MANSWMVRAGRSGCLFDRFKKPSVIALGAEGAESGSNLSGRAPLRNELGRFYPEAQLERQIRPSTPV